MAHWFAAMLGLLALVLLVRLALEWRRYASGGHVIGRRQMALRIASAVDLIVLLALVLMGTRIGLQSATAALIYWMTCMALAFAAMVMAIIDLKILRATHGKRRAESYRRLSMYIRRLERSRNKKVSPGE